MLAAAEIFIEAFKVEYQPWACELCGSVMVSVKAWVREHRPDWLESAALEAVVHPLLRLLVRQLREWPFRGWRPYRGMRRAFLA